MRSKLILGLSSPLRACRRTREILSLEIKRGADRVWGWGGGDACSCYNVPESRRKKEPLLQITALLTGLSLLRLCSFSSSSSCSSCILFSPLPTAFLPRRCQDRMSRFGLEFNDCCARKLSFGSSSKQCLALKKTIHTLARPLSTCSFIVVQNTGDLSTAYFHGESPSNAVYFALTFPPPPSSHLLRRGGGNTSQGSLLLLKNGRLKRRGVRGGEGWIYGRQVD